VVVADSTTLLVPLSTPRFKLSLRGPGPAEPGRRVFARGGGLRGLRPCGVFGAQARQSRAVPSSPAVAGCAAFGLAGGGGVLGSMA
jgi:hypothetical protein